MKTKRGVLSLPQDAAYNEVSSPVGQLTLITSHEGLHAVLWDIDRENDKYVNILNGLKQSKDEVNFLHAKAQLTEYFENKRKVFDLPLVLKGTDFQIQAWQQLMKIPYATTITYAEQAQRIGDKKKARAVGMANGLNPLSIVVPCHRVIGSNGHLVGFAGGMDKKAFLLNLEKNT